MEPRRRRARDVANAHLILAEALLVTGDDAGGREEAAATRARCVPLHYDLCVKYMGDLAAKGTAALQLD